MVLWLAMSQQKKPPTDKEYKYVHWLDVHYWEYGKFPAPPIAAKALNMSIDEIRALNKSPQVKAMCKNRGIEVKVVDIDSLKPEQIAAIHTYLNLADERSLPQKLHELGIPPSRFWGWMKGAVFRDYITECAEALFKEGISFAHRELLAKVMRGDLKAIRLFYDITGRGPRSIEEQNVSLVMSRLIEAIQIEISDTEVIQRIAERFKAIAAGELPTVTKAIPMRVESFNPVEERQVTVIKHPAGQNKDSDNAPSLDDTL
jgi:putative insertion element HTH domain-containing protein